MAIDATKPVDGVPSVKADLRNNLQAVKDVPAVAFAETAAALAGKANQYLKVNAGETALESVAQAAGGDASTTTFTQAGTGAVASTVQAKLREYELSIFDFGAVGDGTTDDTAALQLAINEIAARASTSKRMRLLLPGRFKIAGASLDWTSFVTAKNGVQLIVDGELILTSTLTLNPRVHLIGIGGADDKPQFMTGPCCVITQSGAWTEPVIKALGNADHYIEGISLQNPAGVGLQLGYTSTDVGATQSANFILRRIAILAADSATSIALRLVNAFWVWIDDFSILGRTNSDYAVVLADDFGDVGMNGTGLLHMSNGKLSGRGIHFSRSLNFGSGWYAIYDFVNITMENALTDLITMSAIGGTISRIRMSNCDFADIAGTPPLAFINVTATNSASVRNVSFERCTINDANPLIRGDAWKIDHVHADTIGYDHDVIGTRGPLLGDRPKNLNFFFDGQLETRLSFPSLATAFVPADCRIVALPRDPTSWSAVTGSPTATAGQIAPDGSATAVLFDPGAAVGRYQLFSGSITEATVGSYFIVGLWWRSSTNTVRTTTGPIRITTTGGTRDWDGTGNTVYTPLFFSGTLVANGWTISTAWAQWLGSGATFSIQINADASRPWIVWEPFVVVMPNTYTKRDAHRLSATLALVPEGAAPGVRTVPTYATTRTGIGVTGSRPSATAVGAGAQWFDSTIGKPIWSNGTAWVLADGSAA